MELTAKHEDAPGTEQVKIEVDHEHVFVLRNDNQRQQLEEGAVRRSKLLTDLLDSKPGSQALLPVGSDCLDGWRKYVQLQLADDSSEGLPNFVNEDMVMLVKVCLASCSHEPRRISTINHSTKPYAGQ